MRNKLLSSEDYEFVNRSIFYKLSKNEKRELVDMLHAYYPEKSKPVLISQLKALIGLAMGLILLRVLIMYLIG